MRSSLTLVTWLSSFSVLSALTLPARTALAEGGDTGFEAGLRAGYAIPLGKVTDDAGGDLSEGISGQIPLWLDVGYRATPELFIGLYGQYGFGLLGDTLDTACNSGAGIDCSITDTRLGLQLQYHPAPRNEVDAWIGLGFGYEWMTIFMEGPGAEVSITTSGFELLNLQAGLDFTISESFRVGPAVSFSLGQYSDVSAECTSGAASCAALGALSQSIPNKTLHEWLFLGLRGVYGP